MTSRKQRQSDRISPEVKVLAEVRVLADKPYVRSVDDHFAGYFNELGITINLNESTTDQEIIALRNSLLEYLEKVGKEEKIEFTWQVAFWRGLVQVALLFPGNSPIEPGEPLELIRE
jgi:hypothetical protein